MIQFILMLLGLAWGNQTGYNTSDSGGMQTISMTSESGTEDDGTVEDTEIPRGSIGGNTGQTPP
ncbi:hypothetical protein ACX3PU_03465 [Chryseobacterium sp. A301]